MTLKESWATVTVQQAILESAEVVAGIRAQQHRDFLSVMKNESRAESPIEAVFWIWWKTLEHLDTLSEYWTFQLQPQLEVDVPSGKRYRLDYAVPESRIAVELDGHEFHEKTKEQVTYRNQRDRDLQAMGWMVAHFSGSELLRNPVEVVAALIDLAKERDPKWQGI